MTIDQGVLLQAVLWAAGILVVYAVLTRGLFLAAEPVRRAALDLAVELDASEEYSSDDKATIQSLLDDLHSPFSAWVLALTTLSLIVTYPFRRKKPTSPTYSEELASKDALMTQLWAIGTMANSPAAAFVFLVAISVLTAFVMSGAGLSALLRQRHGHNHDGHGHGHARA